MDDSSDSDDDARRGTLLLADALSRFFRSGAIEGPPRGVSGSNPRRETVLCLALRQGHYFIRSGKSGCWLWFRGARAVRDVASSPRQGDGPAPAQRKRS